VTGVLLSGQRGGVRTLTLNRPDKRNALNGAMVDALHAALDDIDADAEVRVVVLRGAGRDFCAGADLDELLASAGRLPAENERDAMRLGTVLARIRACPRPVVALVQGRALAGGAGLATACDLVIGSESAQLGYPEIQRGFVPAMVMVFLRRLAGEKLALDLVLTGRVLTAAEARDAGLLTQVEPDDTFEAASQALVDKLAAANPSALHLTKKLFYELDGVNIEDGIALGARVNALARTTTDFRDAIARFLAR
jgi:methylglutaconyl-CoA hydratase